MKLSARILILAVVLTAGFAARASLEAHVVSTDALATVGLEQPLDAFPAALGAWQAIELPDDPGVDYADEHLRRGYQHGETGQVVMLWIAYSAAGEDRRHHPEVCMAVAGRQEDRQARTTLAIAGHDAPVQQYRFAGAGASQYVFYWHYMLSAEQPDGSNRLKRLYRRLRQLPSSVTIEVFAPETSADDAAAAAEFVGLVDAALQSHLPDRSVRGSTRLPITLVEGEAR